MAPIASALFPQHGKATPLMEVATINRHVNILAWIHIVMGGGLLLVAIALLQVSSSKDPTTLIRCLSCWGCSVGWRLVFSFHP